VGWSRFGHLVRRVYFGGSRERDAEILTALESVVAILVEQTFDASEIGITYTGAAVVVV